MKPLGLPLSEAEPLIHQGQESEPESGAHLSVLPGGRSGAGAVACPCPCVLSRSWCPRCPHRRTRGSEGLPMLSFPISLISGCRVWCPAEGRWVLLALPCPLSLVLSVGWPRGPARGGHGVVVIWGSAITLSLSQQQGSCILEAGMCLGLRNRCLFLLVLRTEVPLRSGQRQRGLLQRHLHSVVELVFILFYCLISLIRMVTLHRMEG